MKILGANLASTYLTTGITVTDTTMTVAAGTGSLFPVPVAGESYFVLTIKPVTTAVNNYEIVYVTAVSGDTFSITRAQEGTTAQVWPSGSIGANLFTAGTFSSLLQEGDVSGSGGAAEIGAASGLTVQAEINRSLRLTGNFTAGGTITSAQEMYYYGGMYWRWGGTLPKTVTAGSTPSTDGISASTWVEVGSLNVYNELTDVDGATLYPDLQMARWRDTGDVRGWGVVGDGTTDDLTNFQTALNSGKARIYIPSGLNVYLSGTATLPADSFTLEGDGKTSKISGPSSTLLKYATTPASNQSVYTIRCLGFYPTAASALMIDATSVWSSVGKPPHIIAGCYAEFTSTGQTFVNLSGVWSAQISYNYGISVSGADAKTTNTGYGIRTSFTSDLSSSVMNLQIEGNAFTSVAYPISFPARALLTGGRVEGVKILGNNFVNGISGITLTQALAVSITGNQVSDYATACIILGGSFDCSITGNGELTSDTDCIYIASRSDSFSERIVICGNNINSQKTNATCIRLSNTDATSMIRNIAITGNSMRGDGTTTDTNYGVFFAGSYAITGINVTGNNFADMSYGVFFGGISTSGANSNCHISNNTYELNSGGVSVLFPERMSPQRYYDYTRESTVSSTAAMTTVSFDISSAAYMAVPVYAECQLTTQTGIRLVYSFAASSATTAVFNVVGTAVAQTDTFVLRTSGLSPYGF